MLNKNLAIFGIIALMSTLLTIVCSYFVGRSQFVWLMGLYAALFACYLFAVRAAGADAHWQQRYIWLGLWLRIAVLWSIPNWSDDIFRFIWDGRLAVAGVHPFAHTPAYFIENQISIPGINAGLFERLNSPQYFSVYPPLCQAVFALAALLFRENVWGAALTIKLFVTLFDAGSIYWLQHKMKRPRAALLYALNPLVILEICGNAHFEGVMIFFLLAALHALEQARVRVAAVYLAAAVASKLVPLMFVPLVWRWLGWRRGTLFMLVFAGALLLLFLPLLDVAVLLNMGKSLDLYFQKFAFNASVFYLFWEIGLWLGRFHLGNTLGPALALLTLAGILLMSWRLKPQAPFEQLCRAMLWASGLQLLNASTVHPWYVTLPFALGLFGRFQFPVVWTGAVILSYSHYAGGRFEEQYALIVLEYALVAMALLRIPVQSLLSPTK